MNEYIAEFTQSDDGVIVKPMQELVRCKDCHFWDEMPSSSYAPYLHRCRWLDIASRAEFFCQQGMKKDDHS